MRLRTQWLTENDCFKAGRTIRVRGVMVHSTGANNPRVARYVPGDEVMGWNTGGNHWNRSGVQKCVHAFVGKFDGGEIGTVQTLPWNRRGWHAASGKKGSANDTHIGFEICEDGLNDPEYFRAVYQEAVELAAMLCQEHHLDPLADGVVICHQEGYRRGIASNHGDVLHWFPRYGMSMEDFRADTARAMRGEDDQMLSYEQFKSYMEQYRKELGEQAGPAWGREELERARQMGLSDGSRPMDLASRQEVISMIVRAGLTG